MSGDEILLILLKVLAVLVLVGLNGFFVAAEAPQAENTFVYILSHENREKAKENWAKFRDDAEWKKIRAESEKDGPIVTKAETIFVNPTDFSALK